MTAPAVLIIALNAAELSSPTTVTMVRTVSSVLGPTTTVRVEATDGDPVAAARARRQSDDAWIVVDWSEPHHRAVVLHGFVPNGKISFDRRIAFAEEDPNDERGRTIGFVISAMFANSVAQPDARDATRQLTPTAPSKALQSTWGASLAASAAGFGDADSFGATASIERGKNPWWLGLFGEARFGSVGRAQASTRYLSAGLTGNLRLLSLGNSCWLGTAGYAGVSHVTATHFSEDDNAPVPAAAWFPLASLHWRAVIELSSSTWFFAEAGPEYRFGGIDIYVHGRKAAELPALTGIARVGLTARF